LIIAISPISEIFPSAGSPENGGKFIPQTSPELVWPGPP